ncbi:MAG: FAD-dependent protein [Lachnospiraceae bacterium]
MIRINQLKLPIEHKQSELEKKIIQQLHLKQNQLECYKIVKQSLDARKKPELFFSYTIDVKIKGEEKYLKNCKGKLPKGTEAIVERRYQFPTAEGVVMPHRPVIVGCGPAGLFCGFMLAKAGFRPILVERGRCVEERTKDVEFFWETGVLDIKSNVQFGEGGAGTFSDGKLNTLVKDAFGRNRKVLEIFVEHGAPEEILYLNHPHIGTDILKRVVRNIREDILAYGGEVRFETKMEKILTKNQRVTGILLESGETIETNQVILAVGHSARDTFESLLDSGMELKPKAFAVGLRIQHPQSMINQSQYGRELVPQLGAADYKLTYQASTGRGVYSFCMCPGGFVVNSSSEEGRLVVNGMSNHGRDTQNANSALIVTVTPEDFGEEGALSGVMFQRRLEEAAYRVGEGRIPVQLAVDFRENRVSDELGEVIPVMKGKWKFANLREVLPDELCSSIIEAMDNFGKIIQGFDRPDALFAGVESRTSSPVRMERDSENLESLSIKGLYPCGEGAGYAGGITSAAMDGIRVAEAVVKNNL